MDFTDKSNRSLAFKKFTNNRYNVEYFEQPENPTAIDKITRAIAAPGLQMDELFGLIYPTSSAVFNGERVTAYGMCEGVGIATYNNEVVDGIYVLSNASILNISSAYEQSYSWAFVIYVVGSGRILGLTKNTPWQTIVDYLDSLNGGE